MTQLTFTDTRCTALAAVQRDHVRYHSGLAGPALGYTWSEHAGGQMHEDFRHVLRELWALNFIEVETHRVFAQRGHRVITTMNGYRLLCAWRNSEEPSST